MKYFNQRMHIFFKSHMHTLTDFIHIRPMGVEVKISKDKKVACLQQKQ